MDIRNALVPGTRLHFPGMTCTVGQEIGRGSNAIVYQGWYEDQMDASQRHHVLVKELFPFHEGGAIRRMEDGLTLLCEPAGEDALRMHRESFLWGRDVHLRLRERYPAFTGNNINTYAANGTIYSILDLSGGETMDRELAHPREKLTLRSVASLMMGVAESLAVFHEMGCLHLDISPDNILLIRRGSQCCVELIDYNSVVRMADLKPGAGVRFSMKPGFTAPEVRMGAVASIGPWTDLYAAMGVMYRCVAGVPLTRMQQTGVTPIRVDGCPLLADAPETVRSFLRQMFIRGLAPVAKKRYQNTNELLTDLRELIDRIDGVGVTHWALWEMSRKSIQKQIRQNPALAYLTEEKELYPLSVEAPEGSGMLAFLQNGGSAMLHGSGGMGKTTLLMHAAWQETQRYRPDRPAVMYLSLYGYREGETNYIHDSLLQRMQFNKAVATYADARHELDQLLQSPLRGRQRKAPALCLLLDGWNEVLGDHRGLTQEIAALAQMEGVGILLASRSGTQEFAFPAWTLRPLEAAVWQQILRENGLLIPDAPQMQELLTNAMMLSLYVRACKDGEQQMQLHSREELIEAYLAALMDKETRDLPDGDPLRWQLDAAMRCVYPLLADSEGRLRGAEMLTPVMEVYARLGKGGMKRRFPEWTGHLAEIRAKAADGDAWCGMMVHELLWRKLGLLCRDEEGGFRLVHQEFRDVLAGKGRDLRRMLQWVKIRRMLLSTGGVALAAACIALIWPKEQQVVYLPAETATPLPTYEPTAALNGLDKIGNVYAGLNSQYAAMLRLLDLEAPTGMDFETAMRAVACKGTINGMGGAKNALATTERWVSEATKGGDRYPWNRERYLDGSVFVRMTELLLERAESYAACVAEMQVVYTCGLVSEADYRAFCDVIRGAVEADAKVAAGYGQNLYYRVMAGMPEWTATADGEQFARRYRNMIDAQVLFEALDAHRAAYRMEDLSGLNLAVKEAEQASQAAWGRKAECLIYRQAIRMMELEERGN